MCIVIITTKREVLFKKTRQLIYIFIHSFIFFQIYGNDNTQCPDKSGGRNVSRLYIDSSEPSDGGTGIWTQDESLSFECYDNGYKTVKCKCKSYKVFNLVNGNRYVPNISINLH